MTAAKQRQVRVGPITKHLPQREPEGILIQGRVNPELAEALRGRLKEENVRIVDWLEAAIKAYLEEPGR
jgi:hypothetical protein